MPRRSSVNDSHDRHLLPTTVVGSYPQPDWLVDRDDAVEDGAARAHGHLARAGAVARAGAGRRHPARHPRHGARRHRHHHRRRDPPRELLQPLRHRARGHRHGQARARSRRASGHETPVPRVVGKIRRTRRGRGARHAVPARQHRPRRQDHAAGPVHHEPAGR